MNECYFIIECPHCKQYVIIEQINCAIFRHGIYKNNLQQINPHMPKIECEELKNNDLIYGCSKPFRLDKKNDIWIALECDYI